MVAMSARPMAQREPLSFSRDAFDIRRLFPTPIILAPINDAEALNDELAICILDRAHRSDGVVRSNDGGWQSDDDFLAWSGEAGAALIDAAHRLVDQLTVHTAESGPVRTTIDWRINAWANISTKDDANVLHHHPGAFWSGVYWVDAGSTDPSPDGIGGEFEMVDPRGILPSFYAPALRYGVPGCLNAGASDFITPTGGTLLLFPSWLTHAVRRYRGARPRISVAFNFSL